MSRLLKCYVLLHVSVAPFINFCSDAFFTFACRFNKYSSSAEFMILLSIITMARKMLLAHTQKKGHHKKLCGKKHEKILRKMGINLHSLAHRSYPYIDNLHIYVVKRWPEPRKKYSRTFEW